MGSAKVKGCHRDGADVAGSGEGERGDEQVGASASWDFEGADRRDDVRDLDVWNAEDAWMRVVGSEDPAVDDDESGPASSA